MCGVQPAGGALKPQIPKTRNLRVECTAAVQATQSRLSSISAALDAARGEAAGLAAELDAERHRCSEAARAAARAEEQMRTSTGSAALLRDQLKQVRRPAGDSTRILSRLAA